MPIAFFLLLYRLSSSGGRYALTGLKNSRIGAFDRVGPAAGGCESKAGTDPIQRLDHGAATEPGWRVNVRFHRAAVQISLPCVSPAARHSNERFHAEGVDARIVGAWEANLQLRSI